MPTNEQVRELLEKVKIAITLEPEKYDQGQFCGTAFCIAGHIDFIANGPEVFKRHVLEEEESPHSPIQEAAILAIGGSNTNSLDTDLFDADWYGVSYLEPAREALDRATCHAEKAAAGCLAIDLYMKERGLVEVAA